eukprot:COSAG02_NODE_1970_length_10224_cov_104.344691_9_plen_122_part_00
MPAAIAPTATSAEQEPVFTNIYLKAADLQICLVCVPSFWLSLVASWPPNYTISSETRASSDHASGTADHNPTDSRSSRGCRHDQSGGAAVNHAISADGCHRAQDALCLVTRAGSIGHIVAT